MNLPQLSVSNLGWNSEEDESIARILKDFEVAYVDLAMGRYFSKPFEVPVSDWLEVKRFWAAMGFGLAGMQSLLFGVPPVSLFGSAENREVLRQAFLAVFVRAEAIGVSRLVLGSPAHRTRKNFDDGGLDLAKEFFIDLGESANQHGVRLLLEPNSKRYDCNFINTAKEALDFVASASNVGLGVNLDLGAEIDSGGNLEFSNSEISMFGHLHLSEADLSPLFSQELLSKLMATPNLLGHFEFMTIEQLGLLGEDNSTNVTNSLTHLKEALKV
jgi:sugar phosphate isomerase/epimerase